jgi:hypothetical protein
MLFLTGIKKAWVNYLKSFQTCIIALAGSKICHFSGISGFTGSNLEHLSGIAGYAGSKNHCFSGIRPDAGSKLLI